MSGPGYDPAPPGMPPPATLAQAASRMWLERVADTVNRNQQGKLNANVDITIDDGVTSTTLIDARISGFSAIHFMPLTANAAAELAAGTMWVSSQKSGEATITHANAASTDRSFRATIIG